MKLTYVLVPLLVLPGLAAAEEVRSGKAGQSLFLGYYAAVDANCRSKALPVRLTGGADHGNVGTKKGRLKAGVVKRCPKLQAEATILSFNPDPGFRGSDTVSVEVTEADGTTRKVDYAIRID